MGAEEPGLLPPSYAGAHMCMQRCVHLSSCACTHTHTHTHTRLHARTHTRTRARTHQHMHTRTHTYTRTLARIHTCTHAHTRKRAHFHIRRAKGLYLTRTDGSKEPVEEVVRGKTVLGLLRHLGEWRKACACFASQAAVAAVSCCAAGVRTRHVLTECANSELERQSKA